MMGSVSSCHHHFIASHHIISHHITSYHITSHHITSHHITSHHITSYHIISYHITSHHITSHHITSHHIISHHLPVTCYTQVLQHDIPYQLCLSSLPCPTARSPWRLKCDGKPISMPCSHPDLLIRVTE
jgi:hypothetical protein